MPGFCKRLFVPTRFDACCCAIAFHCVVAIFGVTLLPVLLGHTKDLDLSRVFLIFAATWLAIGATLCWNAISRSRTILLLFSSVSSLIFVAIWYYFNWESVRSQAESAMGFSGNYLRSTSSLLSNSKWTMVAAILISVTVWGGNLVLRFTFSKVGKSISKTQGSPNPNRTRFLAFIAVIMFLVAIASRLFSTFIKLDVGPIVLGSCGVVLFWLVALFWFPRSFSLPRRPVQKVVSLLLVLGFLVPFVIEAVSRSEYFYSVAAVVFGIVYVLSVIGVSALRGERGGDMASAAETGAVVVRSRPTLVSFAAIGVVAIAFSLPQCFDLNILASSQTGAKNLTELLTLARQSSAIKWKSGGRISPYFERAPRATVWKIQFDEQASSNVVDAIAGNRFRYVEFCGLTPRFDLDSLKGQISSVKLTDCSVSHTQLNTILGSAAWVAIKGSFSIVDDGEELKVGAFNGVSFRDTEPGAIHSLFAAAKCEGQMKHLIIHAAVGDEDWPAVEEVAQAGRVYLYGGWADGFVVPKQTRSLKNVYFQELRVSGIRTEKKQVDKDLLLDTDISFVLSPDNVGDPDLLWKLMILRGSGDGWYMRQCFKASGKPLAEYAKEVGMAYQLGDDGSIESLYFPWGSDVAEVGSLKSLKVLSFDPQWVGFESVGNAFEPVDVSHLKVLTSLEALYLEAGLIPEDLAFLKDLKSLKHLQVPAVVRKVTGPVGFDACQSLESITFLGTPDDDSWREVSRLKNLSRLAIVNVGDGDDLTEEYLRKLRKKFPDVEIDIIMPKEGEARVPDTFRRYRDRYRKELRADTSWLDNVYQ